MASLYEQMDNLLTPNSFKEGLAKSAEENKDMNLSDTFSFDRFKKEALPQFREKDEIIEKATATGTGLLTGTLGLPSDIISMASAGADLVGDYTNNPTFTVVKDLLNRAEKESGRPAFDKWFTETTGLESNPANTDQLIGEILSPTGAFLVPLKTLNKLFKPLKKGASEFFDDFGANSTLKSANNAPIQAIKKDDVITPNQPTINLNEVAGNTEAGRKALTEYEVLEKNALVLYKEESKIPNDIRDNMYYITGAYRDAKGDIKYKIPTADAQLNLGLLKDSQFNILEGGKINADNIPTQGLKLEQILNFKDLYKQYPDAVSNFRKAKDKLDDAGNKYTDPAVQYSILKDIKIKNFDTYVKERGFTPKEIEDFSNSGTRAMYMRQGNKETIYLSSGSIEEVKSDLLHEIQHAIQRREGHSPGASSDDFLRNPKTEFGQDYLNLEKTIVDEKKSLLDTLSTGVMMRMNKEAKPNNMTVFLNYNYNFDGTIVNSRDIFESATDKLMLTQFNKIFRDGKMGSKQAYKPLPESDIKFIDKGKFILDHKEEYVGYNKLPVKFTEMEEKLINKIIQHEPDDFLYYMRERSKIERQVRNKNLMENQAHIEYQNVIGEKQARKVQSDQEIYDREVRNLRRQGREPSAEEKIQIFRNINPSRYNVYKGQPNKTLEQDVDISANIKEQ